MRSAAVAAIAAVLGAPSLAAAQAPGMYDPTPPLAPPGMTPPAGDIDEPPPGVAAPANAPEPAFRAPSLTAVAPPAAPQLTPIERAARRDAASDRAYGTSTALTVPNGEVDASLRFAPVGGILSLTAGLGAGVEISVDAGGVVGESGVASYGIGAKLALAHKGGWGLAVQGGIHKMGDSESDALSLWNLGAVLSGCSDADCSALLSLGGGVLGSSENSSGDTIPYAWASMLLGTGGFRPIIEGTVLQGGVLGFLGARMGGRHAALDLGIGFLGGDGGDGGALPVAALSVRP